MSDVNVYRVAAYVPVSAEMLDEVGRSPLVGAVDEMVRRYLYPWEFADKPIRFDVALFPRWVEALLRRFDQ